MAIIEVNFISQCLMRTVTFNAIIPADKFGPQAAAQQKPFKALYLLHGIFGNYTDWVNGTRIQAWAEANDLAVIMPSGENRFYLDDEKSGERYGEFIGRELVEFTRKLFPLSDRREDTFIAGLSMGGYGALRNGLKYAETFGCVAGLSSALIYAGSQGFRQQRAGVYLPPPGSIMRRFSATFEHIVGSDKDPKALFRKLREENRPLPKLYMCCGTEDSLLAANRDLRDDLAPRTALDLNLRGGAGRATTGFSGIRISGRSSTGSRSGEAKAGVSSGNVL